MVGGAGGGMAHGCDHSNASDGRASGCEKQIVWHLAGHWLFLRKKPAEKPFQTCLYLYISYGRIDECVLAIGEVL